MTYLQQVFLKVDMKHHVILFLLAMDQIVMFILRVEKMAIQMDQIQAIKNKMLGNSSLSIITILKINIV